MVVPVVATAALFRKALRELGIERAEAKGVSPEAAMKTHTVKGNENVSFVILVVGTEVRSNMPDGRQKGCQ
jgi:hypothetical protein